MAFSRPKLSVVGAGFVGATVAQRMADKELGDVTLIDIVPDMPMGKALDMFESSPVERFDARITGSNDVKDVKGSEVIVVTSGIARKPGMSRDDLLKINAGIVNGVIDAVKEHAPNAILIMVTNPLDVMTFLAHKRSGFPKNRVLGMAGVLDSARMASFVAMELNVSVKDISPMVLGGHGDTMVPLPRFSTVAGIPLTELVAMGRLSQAKLDEICTRTANGGAEITKLVGTSAWYAPGAAAAEMVEAILKDKKSILPCSVYLQGEYGVTDLFVGVPVKLGRGGAEEIIEIRLTPDEQAAFNKSAASVKELTTVIGV